VFTGIVEEVGSVREASSHRLVVQASTVLEGLALGDSIAINGTCLTVTAQTAESFTVDVVEETLSRTNLGTLSAGSPVDLERALTPQSRMGGHIVQGHVDGVGTITALAGGPESLTLTVEAPAETARYIVEKGFIAVDGISLTVTGVSDSLFTVAVIPYTSEHTVLGSKQTGDGVNLEVDIVAKYVERLLPPR
jgi:riboflavin synthase